MPELIGVLIWVIIFCAVGYGLKWVCTSFGLPQPVLWICGAIMLIILLLFISGQFGGGVAFPSFRPH